MKKPRRRKDTMNNWRPIRTAPRDGTVIRASDGKTFIELVRFTQKHHALLGGNYWLAVYKKEGRQYALRLTPEWYPKCVKPKYWKPI